MLPLILALGSSIAYGCADFAGGMAARGSHVLRVVTISVPISLATVILFWPVLGARWSASVFLWGTAFGVASAGVFSLIYLTLSRGPMNVLAPITAVVSEALPVAFGLARAEHLHAPALAGLPLSVVAIVLVGAAPNREHGRVAATSIALAILAGIAIAVELICLDLSPANSGLGTLIVGRSVTTAALLGIIAVFSGRIGAVRPSFPLAGCAGVLDSLASVAFLYAVRHALLAVVAVILALYPTSTLILARIVLHERLSRAQVGGLAVAGGAVVMLALG